VIFWKKENKERKVAGKENQKKDDTIKRNERKKC